MTTVSVGGLIFDGGYGTPYPAMDPVQLDDWIVNAKAFRWNASTPRTDQGEITVWLDCSHADAQVRLRECGALAGTSISVEYVHGTISGLPVASITGEWQAKAGTTAGGVLLVRMTFDAKSDKNSGDVEKCDVYVQTSTVLCGPWTTHDTWICMESSDGLGTYAGEAEGRVVNEVPDMDLIGQWVRLRRKSDDSVQWVGVVVNAGARSRRNPANGQGWGCETTYQFAGVAQAFAQLVPNKWYESREGDIARGALPVPSADGGGIYEVADVCTPIAYNGIKNKDAILRQLDAAPAPTVYMHARGKLDSASEWMAWEALRNTFAQFRINYPTMPRVNLVDAEIIVAGLLDFKAEWTTDGKSLLDIIATILGPAALRTFRIETTTADSGNAADAYFTIYAINLTDAGTEVDLATDVSVDWAANVDGSNTVDDWYLDAGRRDYVTTLKMGTNAGFQGTAGWTDAQETLWGAATEAGRNSEVINNVWRRFTLRQTWGGDNWQVNVIPYIRILAAGEETGELQEVGPTVYPNAPVAWEIDRTIPIGPGKDWNDYISSAYTNKVNKHTPSDGPLVWWYKSGSALDPIHYDFQISVGDGYANLMLGRNSVDAAFIKAKIADGYSILATLDIIHPLHYRASKVNASPPRTDMPRVGLTQLPNGHFHRTDIMMDTIQKLDDAGAAVRAPATGRIDDGADITVARDAFARWYMTPDGGGNWTIANNAVLTPACGSMVSQLKVVVNSDPPVTTGLIVLGGIPITRRSVSWDRYDPKVTWTVSRIAPTFSLNGKGAAIAAGGVPLALPRMSQADGVRNA